ncbi:MAG: hypothetical protein IJ874_03355 [Ruminococcus sp.]|nr:hypothetical protein [Ruminococcus sp.]
MEIRYIHEPTDLQCGQAVLAMVLGTEPEEIVRQLCNDRETTLKEMRSVLSSGGFELGSSRNQVHDRSELPELCLLSLETPRCWHWSLYCGGVFYDPEHGVMDDFPESGRKYYWTIKKCPECSPD